METYAVLLRGINVGGKNKLPMADLRACLARLGFTDISTYIASGNVILRSGRTSGSIKQTIETALIESFKLDTSLIKVLVLSRSQLQSIVNKKPVGFGDQPATYHSDALFLIDGTVSQLMPYFQPREGVDTVWPGNGVVYSQRLSALRTKSRLNKVLESPLYKSLTIRNWNTVTKVLKLMDATAGAQD